MIDTESEAGSWERALLATRPSLRVLTEAELHAPDLIAKIQRSHGLGTMGEARDMIEYELAQRTT